MMSDGIFEKNLIKELTAIRKNLEVIAATLKEALDRDNIEEEDGKDDG